MNEQASTNLEMATPAQVKYLHQLYRSLGWNEDMYRTILNYNFGITSTKYLTKRQAVNFISMLHNALNAIDDRATDKQVYLIRILWAEIDYSNMKEGDRHLNAFLLKHYHKTSLELLTKQECIKLIKQIKVMTSQARARAGKTTVLKRRTVCTLCGQLIMWVELKDGRRVAFDCDENHNATNFHECK